MIFDYLLFWKHSLQSPPKSRSKISWRTLYHSSFSNTNSSKTALVHITVTPNLRHTHNRSGSRFRISKTAKDCPYSWVTNHRYPGRYPCVNSSKPLCNNRTKIFAVSSVKSIPKRQRRGDDCGTIAPLRLTMFQPQNRQSSCAHEHLPFANTCRTMGFTENTAIRFLFSFWLGIFAFCCFWNLRTRLRCQTVRFQL